MGKENFCLRDCCRISHTCRQLKSTTTTKVLLTFDLRKRTQSCTIFEKSYSYKFEHLQKVLDLFPQAAQGGDLEIQTRSCRCWTALMWQAHKSDVPLLLALNCHRIMWQFNTLICGSKHNMNVGAVKTKISVAKEVNKLTVADSSKNSIWPFVMPSNQKLKIFLLWR